MSNFAEYTEGIAPDGPAILKDGHAMFPQDIVKDLNRKSYLEERVKKIEYGLSCTCLTKTDDPEEHNITCRYRLLKAIVISWT